MVVKHLQNLNNIVNHLQNLKNGVKHLKNLGNGSPQNLKNGIQTSTEIWRIYNIPIVEQTIQRQYRYSTERKIYLKDLWQDTSPVLPAISWVGSSWVVSSPLLSNHCPFLLFLLLIRKFRHRIRPKFATGSRLIALAGRPSIGLKRHFIFHLMGCVFRM